MTYCTLYLGMGPTTGRRYTTWSIQATMTIPVYLPYAGMFSAPISISQYIYPTLILTLTPFHPSNNSFFVQAFTWPSHGTIHFPSFQITSVHQEAEHRITPLLQLLNQKALSQADVDSTVRLTEEGLERLTTLQEDLIHQNDHLDSLKRVSLDFATSFLVDIYSFFLRFSGVIRFPCVTCCVGLIVLLVLDGI